MDTATPERDRIAWLGGQLRVAGAPLVLAAVLLTHVALRATADLTPWKGGGFGMFSTIDSPGTRLLRIEVDDATGARPVALPPSLDDLAGEVRAAPSEAAVGDLARRLAAQWWVVPRLAADGPATPETEALDRLAITALAQVAPIDTVRAVEPAAYDATRQRRVEIRSAEVSVWRLRAEDGTGDLRPELIRRASAPAPGGPAR